MGMADLLLSSGLNEEQQDFAETIRVSGEALMTIVEEILDFSKLESGNMVLEEQPFDVMACVEEVIELLAPKAAEQRLALAYYVEEKVPTKVIGDGTRMRQILINLLANAIKFTDVGEVYLSVAADSPSPGRSLLRFTIRDTGIGIPADQIPRMFDSFTQLDGSSTRRHGGTGLGLTISKQLCELMGGTIGATSEVGVGSTFHFTLPLPLADDAQTVGEQLDKLRAFANKRILIIGEAATPRTVMEKYLTRWGMVPRSVATAEAARQVLGEDAPFDLALVEMDAASTDRLSLAQELQEQHPDLSMILLVGVDGAELRQAAQAAGFDSFLHKPVKPGSLIERMNAYFDQAAMPIKRSRQLEIDPTMALHHPRRILLAEDNEINQKVVERLLERMGYRIDVATSGLDVLAAVGERRYDLIFMDVQMPDIDGVDATRYIRQHAAEFGSPYIVALTAAARKEDREECLAAGMDEFVAKPISIHKLTEVLMCGWRDEAKDRQALLEAATV